MTVLVVFIGWQMVLGVPFAGLTCSFFLLQIPDKKVYPMLRSASYAFVVALLLSSAAGAEVIDPVFVRGTRDSGSDFDKLSAFNSASDMADFTSSFWAEDMANSHYEDPMFFDGTNYYRISFNTTYEIHNYGSVLSNLLNDQVQSTQTFNAFYATETWFADSDGGIYQVYRSNSSSNYYDRIKSYASIADVVNQNSTIHTMSDYVVGDRFFSVNGKYYRTNVANDEVTGLSEYNSFADLLGGQAAVEYNSGVGDADDLFMAVPQAALGSAGYLPVPEIDPAGMGSVLALVTGALGLLERRRLKAKLA